MGGKHAESDHINLLMDCARICNTNADFMHKKLYLLSSNLRHIR